jgi:hypothetical protein
MAGCYGKGMGNLTEIEAAVERLPLEQKRELLRFLAAQISDQNSKMPAPRKFSKEQIQTWIAQDEADMQGFNEGK